MPESLTAEQESCLWTLPEKWQWLQIGTFCFVTKLAGFEYTDYVKYDPKGDLKVLKAENAGQNGFKATAYSMIRSETVANLKRSFLNGGELLVVFVGAGVGQVALVPENERFFLGPNIGMVRPYSTAISSRYLELFLRADEGKKLLLISSKAVAQSSISMGAIRATPVAIPPLEEQAEIVRRIESAFSWLDRVAADHAAAARLIPKLDAAILAKAFRGELVPQDPNDEPASVLLERIKAERAAAPKVKRGRKAHLPPITGTADINLGSVTVSAMGTVGNAPKRARKVSMTKSRQDDDVKGKSYLAGLLKSGRFTDAQTLFRAADLPVADFYKQLAWEIDAGYIIDSAEELKAA
jgi:type I restriction enzyme S subunit